MREGRSDLSLDAHHSVHWRSPAHDRRQDVYPGAIADGDQLKKFMRGGRESDERGQAIVLVALSLVVLLLFAALAVDGGRFVSERRYLQNAADAAALAGVLEWRQALGRGETEAQAEVSAKNRA